MEKIVIAGKVTNRNRTQDIMKVILGNFRNYSVYYNDFYKSSDVSTKILHRILRKLKRLLELLTYMNAISHSSTVFLPAMSVSYHLFKFARLLKKRIVTDFFISIYDTQLDWGKDATTRRQRRIKSREREIIEESDTVIFLNEVERDRYTTLLGASKYKASIIPLYVGEKPAADLSFFRNDKLTFEICWWGSYIPLHGLERILEAAEILANQNIKFKLNILGDSDERGKRFRDLLNSKNLGSFVDLRNDITFSNGRLQDFLLHNCDLALNTFGASEKAKNVITHKCLEALSMKIPVVTGANNALEHYFSQDMIFYCENNPSSIAGAIVEVMNTPRDEIEARIINAHATWSEKFSYGAFLSAVKRVFP